MPDNALKRQQEQAIRRYEEDFRERLNDFMIEHRSDIGHPEHWQVRGYRKGDYPRFLLRSLDKPPVTISFSVEPLPEHLPAQKEFSLRCFMSTACAEWGIMPSAPEKRKDALPAIRADEVDGTWVASMQERRDTKNLHRVVEPAPYDGMLEWLEEKLPKLMEEARHKMDKNEVKLLKIVATQSRKGGPFLSVEQIGKRMSLSDTKVGEYRKGIIRKIQDTAHDMRDERAIALIDSLVRGYKRDSHMTR